MGGNAFPHLSTPRMSPTIYQYVKSQLLTVLRPHFKHADAPIEGPAKKDHGDIDIFVCDTFDEKVVRDTEALAEIVGAKEWKRMRNEVVINFAMVWPEEEDVEEAFDSIKIDDLSHDSKSPHNSPDSSSISIGPSTNKLNAKLDSDSSFLPQNPKKSQKYIQLDLTIIPTYNSYTWQLFHHSHSDLWPILGSLLRRYGLSARPSGFYINIPEIEGMNRNLSLVIITEEPKEVLAYLGLDESAYWKEGGFETWDELCAYVRSMRFADLGRWKRKEEHERLEREENAKVKAGETVMTEAAADEDPSRSSLIIPNDDNGTSSASITPLPSRTPTLLPALGQRPRKCKDTSQDDDTSGGLNNNDRRRLNSRPLFSYYHSTYVPSHSSLNTPPGRSAHLSKLEVVDDVKSFFGQDFARRYDEARRKGIKEVLEVKFWVDVRNLIKAERAMGAELGYGVKGVRSMIGEGVEDPWAWVDDEEVMGTRNESACGRARAGAHLDAYTDADVRSGTGLESNAPNGLIIDTPALDSGNCMPNGDVASSETQCGTINDKTNGNINVSNSDRSANPPISRSSPRSNPKPDLNNPEVTSLRDARAAFRDLRYDEVMNWVKANWRRAGEIQREVDEGRGREKMRVRMAREHGENEENGMMKEKEEMEWKREGVEKNRAEKQTEMVKIEEKVED